MVFDFNNVKYKVFEALSDGREVYRKVLIREVVALFALQDRELRNDSPNGTLNRLKSTIGSVITKLINDGDLLLGDNKKLSLTKFKTIIIDENKIEEFVLAEFTTTASLPFDRLYQRAIKHFKTAKTDTLHDDQSLEEGLKNVLAKLGTSGLLTEDNGTYHAKQLGVYPLSPIGACIKASHEGKPIDESLIDAINIMGGEFFEVFCATLLERYYRAIGHHNYHAKVTGGANDNGIDVSLRPTCPLGFQEKIIVQCKARRSAEVTLNEVRQFAGAFYTEKATKGIFITNNVFHSDVAEFLRKTNGTIVGIDKEKLVQLACDLEVGVKCPLCGPCMLDEQMFLTDTATLKAIQNASDRC